MPRARAQRRRLRSRTPAGPAAGFTLVEVLVALAVFAVAATALVQAGAQRAEDLGYLRDRTLTSWIAADRLAALRLEPGWPTTGSRDGEVEMAGQEWYWQADIERTANPAVRRVEIAVSGDRDGEPVTRMTGFLGDPADTPAGADDDGGTDTP